MKMAAQEESSATDVSWSDAEATYTVRMRIIDRRSLVDLESLPHRIAERSLCACGGTLRLSDHSLKTLDHPNLADHLIIEFYGQYVCDVCRGKKNTALRNAKRLLKTVWRKTKKVEFGPGGLKFEKGSGSDESGDGVTASDGS